MGHLEKNARGKLAITRVELHPQVTFGADRRPTAEELHALHERAHAECFIANPVLTEVTVADPPVPRSTSSHAEHAGAWRRRLAVAPTRRSPCCLARADR